ncbi:hypothetical protein [Ottowia testudinis]|uniref:Uncharacterized protein n=1 Tax=Ottowia testudinis TaxID=2816950 RepID=A0A975CBW3_9BURK|nr:hypothetical protein [Ottowia testudinis]QTD43598.1 hypothetical protein J1M35_10435 [Ottowia testudinis]
MILPWCSRASNVLLQNATVGDSVPDMSKLTPRERTTSRFAGLFFAAGCVLVVILQTTIGLYFTRHYFVAHFLLGLFLPFLFYSMGGMRLTFWTGMALTATWHFGYEFWEDQRDRPVYTPDWDQIVSGTVGLVAAWATYHAWNRHLDARAQSKTAPRSSS